MEQTLPKKLGRFVIAQKLGDGRNGEVYRCWDPEHQREMAVKTVKPDISGKVSFRGPGLTTINSISEIDHPQICRVSETVDGDDGFLLVRDFIDGRSVALPSLEPVSLNKDFLCLAINLARALEAIHKQKLVHGNIKLSNFMFGPQEQVQILDYGISVDFDIEQLEEEGTPYNWIQYLSPEMLNGEGPSRPADIYALGVVFYELCCARMPFEAETNRKLISAIIDKPPDMDLLRSTGLHGVSMLLIRKMLSKSAVDRFIDAAELLVTLEEMAQFSAAKDPLVSTSAKGKFSQDYLMISLLTLIAVFFWIVLATISK